MKNLTSLVFALVALFVQAAAFAAPQHAKMCRLAAITPDSMPTFNAGEVRDFQPIIHISTSEDGSGFTMTTKNAGPTFFDVEPSVGRGGRKPSYFDQLRFSGIEAREEPVSLVRRQGVLHAVRYARVLGTSGGATLVGDWTSVPLIGLGSQSYQDPDGYEVRGLISIKGDPVSILPPEVSVEGQYGSATVFKVSEGNGPSGAKFHLWVGETCKEYDCQKVWQCEARDLDPGDTVMLTRPRGRILLLDVLVWTLYQGDDGWVRSKPTQFRITR